MAQELGRIEKPEADAFKLERRIYLIPLIFAPAEPPAEYAALLERFWSGADEQVSRLEARLGPVNHVYMELVDQGGEAGLTIAGQISPGAAKVAKERVDRGAVFQALEDGETLAEATDWERCLMIGLASRAASEYVSKAYQEAGNRRYRLMAQRLDETLKDGESGIAFLSERHRLQFPDTIRVFYVAPPALDEIHRWLRSYRERAQVEERAEEDSGEPGEDKGEAQP
jgi:hypothetical protein